jgi:hypothetical protein
MRDGEANDVAIETYRIIQIAHREVDFEEIQRFNHHTPCRSGYSREAS